MARHRSAARICIAGPRPSRSPRARAESSRRALDPAFRCFKGAATFPLDRLQERRRRESRTRRVNRPLPGATSHSPRDAVSTLRHLPSCRSLALSPEQKRSTVQGWTVQTRPVTLFHPGSPECCPHLRAGPQPWEPRNHTRSFAQAHPWSLEVGLGRILKHPTPAVGHLTASSSYRWPHSTPRCKLPRMYPEETKISVQRNAE